MSRRKIAATAGVALAVAGLGAWLMTARVAYAHCDTLDGPVVTDAEAALETGDVTPMLKWVKKEHEEEIKAAFKKTLAVRAKGPEAKELADTYFFGTLVRIHRAGEGAPYTGLKPAGQVEPPVAAADKAIDAGSVDELAKKIGQAAEKGVKERFERLMAANKHKDESVEAGRKYVEAYVIFVHYVEGLHNTITAASAHGHPEVGHGEEGIDHLLQTQKESEVAERKRHLAAVVSKETIREKVTSLLYKTYWVGDPLLEVPFVNANRYISTLDDDPRVRSLVQVAVRGSEAEKQELLDALVTMCHIYLDELPLFMDDPDAPWQPSVRWPGGGRAFPYLLTYVDKDATTLGLLTRMYLKMQDALKGYHKVEDDEWFSSKQGLIFAYACDHFLNVYSNTSELHEKLSPGQLQVLKEYADHRKSRDTNWDLDVGQCVVMEFAVAFSKAGSKGADAG